MENSSPLLSTHADLNGQLQDNFVAEDLSSGKKIFQKNLKNSLSLLPMSVRFRTRIVMKPAQFSFSNVSCFFAIPFFPECPACPGPGSPVIDVRQQGV
jgi:hypothetical protein